ncbi:M48 family metalloprotease [Dyadobacter subterraneus]|uniref:M48 family metalloprotease n=1 Tax=Dyadobacter subterraneus TaxID=2773304 RepID=A0ABR9WH97_9BACT|nr:M48 family metalloprotease [Dyadobacter subterraneus]MBE9464872.1 M48 family metalloprotease [Dyadobacter subterraneus]
MTISRNQKVTLGFVLIIVIFLFSFFHLFRKTQINPITGKKQRISMTIQQEIELGLQCAPDIAAKYGGLHPDTEIQNRIKNIGQKLVAVQQISKSPYQFDFHVLADSQTSNTISFPGGQIFITNGLLKLLQTDDKIAVVLSHEIGHVINRHTTEKLSGFDILESFKDSSSVTLEYTPSEISNYISDILKLTFDATEEEEADDLSIKYLVNAGYNPNSLSKVLMVLKEKSDETDFLNRHPISESRIDHVKITVRKYSKSNQVSDQ